MIIDESVRAVVVVVEIERCRGVCAAVRSL